LIVFDTNELYGLHRKSPKFDLLMALRQAGAEQPGIPWVAREELVAKQVLEYSAAWESARAAVSALNRKAPWDNPAVLPQAETEKAIEHWRGIYAEVLTTLETSGDDALEALAREAYCRSPAKKDPKAKGGARDAAIWLTVTGYLKAHPDEHVYFVCNNAKDFGNGSSYPAAMLDDLGDMKDRLTILASFDDVIARFTQPIEVDPRHAGNLLGELSAGVLAQAGHSAQATLTRGPFEGTRFTAGGVFETCWWDMWTFSPAAFPRSVGEASGHKIGGNEWYTASAEWILVGYAQPSLTRYVPSLAAFGGITPDDPPDTFALVACTWSTKILFSPGTERLTVIEAGAPAALDPGDRAELMPLVLQAAEVQEQQVNELVAAISSQLGEPAPQEEPGVPGRGQA
jgi:hypothetical protein